MARVVTRAFPLHVRPTVGWPSSLRRAHDKTKYLTNIPKADIGKSIGLIIATNVLAKELLIAVDEWVEVEGPQEIPGPDPRQMILVTPPRGAL
jgi:hypothetical protein